METHETRGPRATAALGRRFARRLRVGDCVALAGPLGAGKTVLIRGIATGLGLGDERLVASPTFVLVREYAGRLPIYHVDLYRTTDPPGELAGLGLEEMLAEGVVLIEWADRAADALPQPRWWIDIEITGEKRRKFTVRRVD
ncbi:MAG: tRNA (adenosine(37)-N6)-threonylcarbamoyltransferase complex ATPase subunit type 1 TsaE [Planctomycetota bacterium]|jgi:tRNA threonylcarbamoyladenosine biosynthesis protein TsaE